MPKVKTRKNAAKRFKVTGSGKIVHRHSNKSHLNRKKSGSHYRRLSVEITMEGDGMTHPVRKMLNLGVPK
ncbi:MAG: 50S ribosomal protein L35 [Armatimonadetes bacterium]|nr:50S ribosomal protein L35 [Armatimonadota bacterium]